VVSPSPTGSSVVAWSPDAKELAVADGNGPLHLWEFSDGVPGPALDGASAVTALAWSPDGRYLAAADDQQNVEVHDMTTGTRSAVGLLAGPRAAIAWQPDSTGFAVTDGSAVTYVEAASAGVVARYEAPGGLVTALAFAPDGRRLALSSDYATWLLRAVPPAQACATVRSAINPASLAGLIGPAREAPRCSAGENPDPDGGLALPILPFEL
jgi:WD40 repeat protein